MRTTLDIDEKLMDVVVALTREKNKRRAVSKALEEYVRQKRIQELRAMAGKIELVDNLKELEELEIREMGRAQW